MAKQNKEVVDNDVEVKVTDADYANNLLTTLKVKSVVIRQLDAEKWTRSRIANALGIRYQHVRNVLTQPLKRVA